MFHMNSFATNSTREQAKTPAEEHSRRRATRVREKYEQKEDRRQSAIFALKTRMGGKLSEMAEQA